MTKWEISEREGEASMNANIILNVNLDCPKQAKALILWKALAVNDLLRWRISEFLTHNMNSLFLISSK